MERLKEIVKGIKFLCSQELGAVSNDMILDCAVRIYNTGRMTYSHTLKGRVS